MFDQLTTGLALWFSIPAFVGTLVFVIRLGLMFIGGEADSDIDLDADVGGEIEADPGHGLQIFSLSTIASFLMGFGWAGLIGFTALDLSVTISALLGLGGGAALVWLITILLKAVYDLQSSGNVSMEQAMGMEGAVYLTVPGGDSGRGRVRVVINETAKIYDAVTEGEALERNARVRVAAVNADRTLTVVRV